MFLSIEAAARRFGLREGDVREILKTETDRAYDGEAMRLEWTLTARRLRRMELAFDRKAIDDLDCAAAIVAIKARAAFTVRVAAAGTPARFAIYCGAPDRLAARRLG